MLILATTLACLLFLVKIYLDNKYSYWRNRGVSCPKYSYILGNLGDLLTLKKSLGQIFSDIYNASIGYNYVGFYKFLQPGIILINPELIKTVLVKDFDYFHDNDFYVDEKHDLIFGKSTLVLKGDKWKTVRSQLTPTHTTSKIKLMTPLLLENSNKFVKFLESLHEVASVGLEARQLISKYTIENVATCVFGVDGQIFTNPDAVFHRIGKELTKPSIISGIKMICFMLVPQLSKLLKIKFFSSEIINFLRNCIKENIEYRKTNNIARPDYLQSMIQLMLKINNIEEFNIDDITAHTGGFFGDGFLTSSVVISYTLYEIAANKNVQSKLQLEISEVMKTHGDLNYEAIQDMKYLDLVLKESIRKHPPFLTIRRLCTKTYKLPPLTDESNFQVTIEPGTPIMIPIYALHNDKRYFPEPEKFIPERFESNEDFVKNTFLGFGDGPRICLGMKFGILQAKTVLATLILKYKIDVNKKTVEPLQVDPKYFMMSPVGGLWLNFEKRDK